MGYIRFDVSKVTDANGRTVSARIKHIYSDMGVNAYDLNRIMHTLAAPEAPVQMWMTLGVGVLDRDKLKNREFMILDSGTLGVDYL